jgi:hypothetical protein
VLIFLLIWHLWKEVDLCQALVDALRRDYVNFVELLMDYGTSLEKLTLNNLEQIYASSDVCIIQKWHVYSTNSSFIWLLDRLAMDYHWEIWAKNVCRQDKITIRAIFPMNLTYVYMKTSITFHCEFVYAV